MIDALAIGYAIKDRRAQLGLTQAQLAEAAGVSKRCLWSLELGQNPGVRLDNLTAVLGVLGIELSIAVIDEPNGGEAAPAAPSAPATSAPIADAPASANSGNDAVDVISILTGGGK